MDKVWDGDSTIVLLLKFKWAEVISAHDKTLTQTADQNRCHEKMCEARK